MDLLANKRERMFSLVAQWRESGQSQKDFCVLHGMKVCTLAYWIRRSGEKQGPGGFREISSNRVQTDKKMEVEYPNGVKVQVDVDLALLAQLIHLY